jgi:Zn-dependent peptidase ImmA (M78 family)/transcriptional regulator with XRE-family HTH domain
MIGTPGFIGQRLAQAREARGLTAVALSEMIGVRSANISYYEKGKQTPSPEVMDRISQVLNCPRSHFLRPAKSIEEGCIWYRSITSATKMARTRAEARFSWLKEIVDYFRAYLDFPKLNVPDFSVPNDATKIRTELIEEIALECRRFWNLEDSPIADLVLLLENNGLVVALGELGTESLDSFSQWASDGFPFIFLNSDKASAVRLRFDTAHELGHILLHKRLDRKQFKTMAIHRLIEDQCHRFALALLLPAQRFASELWAPTLNGFYTIKERWKVSIAGMIKRCEQLEILNEEQARRAWINLSRRGWKRWEPLDDKLVRESPRLLKRSIELLIESGIKSKDQLLTDIALSASDLEDLATLPPGYMSDKTGSVVILPKMRGIDQGGNKEGKLTAFRKVD